MIKLTLLAVILWPQEKAPEGATIIDASQLMHEDGKPCDWPLVDGALEVGKGHMITKEKYQDFQLHVEFNIPEPPEGAKDQARSNSGVYLQRRYEVQILESYGQDPPLFNGCGSLYRQKAPDKNAAKKPGEWQTYDITFKAARFEGGKKTAGARITVVWNGVKVHDDYEIKDKTGAGKPEGPEPGPILFQDHGAKVKFRNIWILPRK
ncbi:MAG TPA: DUF1080 domain-containing protein [Planctomycetota bacterium]|nr:DUF1080 domain-containing protein [Planctomycetota bacterium]